MFRQMYIFVRKYAKTFHITDTFYLQKSKLNNRKIRVHKNACFGVNAYFSISLQITFSLIMFIHYLQMCNATQYL
jgi:hypothetical protein